MTSKTAIAAIAATLALGAADLAQATTYDISATFTISDAATSPWVFGYVQNNFNDTFTPVTVLNGDVINLSYSFDGSAFQPAAR